MKQSGNRPKMSPSDRAKQFLPFAALKGYEEALRAKEREIEEMHRQDRISPDEDSDTPWGSCRTPF